MKRPKFSDGLILDAVNGLNLSLVFLIFAANRGLVQQFFINCGLNMVVGMSPSCHMIELEEEIRRLNKIYLKGKLKAEIVSEAFEKVIS